MKTKDITLRFESERAQKDALAWLSGIGEGQFWAFLEHFDPEMRIDFRLIEENTRLKRNDPKRYGDLHKDENGNPMIVVNEIP